MPFKTAVSHTTKAVNIDSLSFRKCWLVVSFSQRGACFRSSDKFYGWREKQINIIPIVCPFCHLDEHLNNFIVPRIEAITPAPNRGILNALEEGVLL